MELLIALLAFMVFDLAAWRWGADSRDGLNSDEWPRRHRWPAFGDT